MNKSNLIVLTPEFVQNNLIIQLVKKQNQILKENDHIIQKSMILKVVMEEVKMNFIYKMGDEITRVELNSGDYKPEK